MRGKLAALAIVAAAMLGGPAAAQEKVGAAAVWQPGPGFMEQFHKECDGRTGTAFDACFAAAMAKAGAAPAALAFTRRLDNEAYLAALGDTGGPIAVAHVCYPFRANENDAWFVVNGMPALIDVDDRQRLRLDALHAALRYREIQRRFPQVSFWPGSRGAAGPEIRLGGQQFVVGYLLRNQCHACAVVGRVRFAFNFDHSGRFLGTRLISVVAADR